MTAAFGADQTWAIAYISGVIAVLAIVRWEFAWIRSAGQAFHREFAPHIRGLQEKAWSELTGKFPEMFPSFKQLISNPPKAPKEEGEETELRRQFQTAMKEVVSLATSVNTVSEPDMAFNGICALYKEKARQLWQVAISGLLLSLLVPFYLAVDYYSVRGVSGVTVVFIAEIGVLFAGMLLMFSARLWRTASNLDLKREALVDAVDQKIYGIQKVPLVEGPTPEPLPSVEAEPNGDSPAKKT